MKKLRHILLLLLLLCSCTIVDTDTFPPVMAVHFIDVAQGDAIIIQVNAKNILIDSGPKDSRNKVLDYIKSLNIKKFDYIIATHPHEDHIGNMSAIIKRYDLDSFYAPNVSHTSKSFEMMVESLISKNKKINILNTDTKSIYLGNNTSIVIYSPENKSYGDNLNLYSAVFRIQYGDTSFLFTGDAEVTIEAEMLNKNYYLQSDILKIAHHGSSTSTSQSFYDAVSPRAVVISVGKDNMYNHPSSSLLEFLSSKDSLIYRTDTLGDIVLISDGSKIYKKSSSK